MSKKPAPTLIDRLYRGSFRTETIPTWKSNSEMRRAIISARRFIVDEAMSRFMADLANESFRQHAPCPHPAHKREKHSLASFVDRAPHNHRLADSLRVQARLPHESIWIEYLMHPYQQRSHEIRGVRPPDEKELFDKEGWLIQQHPKIDTACIMHCFLCDDEPDRRGFSNWTFPLAMGWTCDDSPLPWQTTVDPQPRKQIYRYPSALLLGIGDYNRENVSYVQSPLICDPEEKYSDVYGPLMVEWVGVLRRAWSLLATIDHLPIITGDVRQSKGFLARGQIRKFLDHQTIKLNVPAKQDTRVIARKMIAAAHRRRHEVRGHWRDDWRNPPSKLCNPHIWETVNDNPDLIRCEQCHGRQVYVHKHERGDATLGYVLHSYQVTHETPDRKRTGALT